MHLTRLLPSALPTLQSGEELARQRRQQQSVEAKVAEFDPFKPFIKRLVPQPRSSGVVATPAAAAAAGSTAGADSAGVVRVSRTEARVSELLTRQQELETAIPERNVQVPMPWVSAFRFYICLNPFPLLVCTALMWLNLLTPYAMSGFVACSPRKASSSCCWLFLSRCRS